MTMKIFHWLHNKLQPSTEYCRVSHTKDIFDGDGGRKEDLTKGEVETDTTALLLHNVLDGILTIGTLGNINDQPHPTLLNFASLSPQQCHASQHETPPKEKVEEVITVAVVIRETALVVEPLKLEPSLVVVEYDKKMKTGTVEAHAGRNSAIELVEPLLKEDREKRERERGRMTLADLFAAADADSSKDKEPPSSGKKACSGAGHGITQHAVRRVKHGGKFGRPKEGDEPLPLATISTKKLHQLITKMLKKRIHPADAARDGAVHAKESEPLACGRMERITTKAQAAPTHPDRW